VGLLLDARGHGQTTRIQQRVNRPHNFTNAAMDIVHTLGHLGLQGDAHSPAGVVGHSFGGRLALQYLSMLSTTNKKMDHDIDIRPPKVTWLLDTVPGVAHSSVANVIKAVSSVSMPVASKSDLITQLTNEQHNIDPMIANWMTTNLVKSENSTKDAFDFNFDLEMVQELLDDFPKQDFLRELNTIRKAGDGNGNDSPRVEIVRAGRNKEWKEDIVQELESMPHVNVHKLPNAGHWVHVDALKPLVDLMIPSFEL
jgi:pimeloyl-ACP methyl ester carboxylesterase